MKRKVRAQRKYAQGAYIPPSAPPVTPLLALLERRAESQASSSELNVVVNQMSAKDILDIVSFRNVHNLWQPVVRLNRMDQELRERKEEEERKRKHPAEAAEEPGAGASSQGRANMQLRSRHHHSFKPCKTGNQKKKKPQPRLLDDGMPTKSMTRKSKRQSVADSDDLEDDRPLKYLKSNQAKPTARAATRAEPVAVAAADAPRAKTRSRSDASRAKVRAKARATTRAKQRPEPRDTTRDKPRDTTRDKPRDTTRDTTRDQPRDPTDAPRAKHRTTTRHTARDTARAPSPSHPPAALDDAELCATERELASRAYDVYDFNNSDEESIPLRYGSPDSVGRCESKREASDHNGPDDLDLITEFQEPSPVNASNRRSATAARHDAIGPDIMVSVFEGRLSSVASMADKSQEVVHTQIVTVDVHTPPCAQSPARDLQPPADETLTHAGEFQPLLRDVKSLSLDYQPDTQTLGAESPPHALEIQSLTLGNQPSGPESQLPTRERCSTPRPANAEPRYLDIIPFGNHIIQITNEPVGKGEKNIMRARFVPKPLSINPNEAQFIEHEDLLAQLLRAKKEVEIPILVERRPVRVIGNVIVIPDDGVEELPADVKPSIISSGVAGVASTSSGAAAVARTSRGSTAAAVARTSRDSTAAAVASTSRGSPAPSRPTSRKQSGAAPPREMGHTGGDSVEAPVFYPTDAEFNDPLAYFEKIAITASKYGLCKVVAPPGFNPTCALSDDVRFTVSNQYIARLYSRWGPASREMCAIKAYLASQSVVFSRAPLNEGIEVNLPKMYHVVQRNGGLKKVIEKKRWGRVAEEMHFTRGANPEKRVDQFYVKYLLPYDTLSNQERHNMMNAVERSWNQKNQKMLKRAAKPLHRQKRLLGESESSSDEDEVADNLASALSEAEDCVVSGRTMNLNTFRKVAASAMATMFPTTEQPTPDEVEKEYWRLVLLGTEHVCVNTASIDTGDEGYGFTKNKADPYGRHPWNLKMVSQNSGNVLRSLGPVLGVTVPTLHLGMVCSTSCWHRDPHGLPWVEYMHDGPPKIWYGIPGEQSENFRKAVETLCPTSCQNKSIWLPSDITMIPPNLLREHNVSLSRVVQRPGEYIVVFPKAYSCSISTGFTQSESVYFATKSWLMTVTQVFQEVRESCEPTMFSLEQLLLAVVRDTRAPLSVLVLVLGNLRTAVLEEAAARLALARAGVNTGALAQAGRSRHKRRPAGAWNVREQDECEICRTTLFFSKVTGLIDKNRSVCLQHALRLLAAGRAADTGMLVTNYLQTELEDAIEMAERRLNVTTSRSRSRSRPRLSSVASSTAAPD